MSFNIDAKSFFLTYPQCPIPKEELYNMLITRFIVNRILVASEKHADGSPHLHVFMELKNRFHSRDPRCMDFTYLSVDYHPNIQGCRSPKRVLMYCTKKEDYKSNFNVDELNKSNKKHDIGKLILNGKSVDELIIDYPELIFDYNRLIQNVDAYRNSIKWGNIVLPKFLPNPWGKVLPTYGGKLRHYWIYSTMPNKGKTFYFARGLEREFGFHIQSGDFTYWNLRGNETGIILDDYNSAKLTYAFLDTLADGTASIRVAYRGVVRIDRAIIIVLSNKSIRDLYPIMNHLLYARFKEYCIDSWDVNVDF